MVWDGDLLKHIAQARADGLEIALFKRGSHGARVRPLGKRDIVEFGIERRGGKADRSGAEPV